ncbi:MFS general substrate transporter [Aaosphaeria arxii CBS 175.79]|uniref:MFS general substrate transporter n=1 Tax=Aaosphaeria arxii CBS 175.79 TaxID=1450172 RepID=A0A6A5XCU3_9PLEO|nr:MFS general substrate transporter [Aaosphaeria arxii CBS 175.79]KAF2010721.1 MFS general substrate transporter [Aaosphaeria arxii CBS 175.79]
MALQVNIPPEAYTADSISLHPHGPTEEDLESKSDISTLPPTESPYPDGGLDAWLVVLGAWCAMIPSMGLLNTLAILQAWVSEHELHGLPESKIGWIFSCYAFFLYLPGVQVGPIVDKYDIRVVVIPGSIGIVTSLVCLSFCKEFYQFLLSFGVLGGISASFLFNPSVAAIGHWFKCRRAFAAGIAFTAGGLGGIAFPLIMMYVAPEIGFPWTMRIIALICAVVLLVACILLRKRLPNNPAARTTIDIKALRDPKFATTTLGVFLIEFAVFIPYSYICSYALHAGFEPHDAYMLNVLLNVGAMPGRVLPGYVADRFGTFNTMCVTAFVCATLLLTLWLTAGGDERRVTAFTILFGFWSGAAISLTPVSIAQVSKVEDLGKRSGTAFCISSVGALIGIPIAGAILERDGGEYVGLIVFAGVAYAVAFAAYVLARVVSGGWRLALF